MKKISYNSQITYDVSEEEKEKADKALTWFGYLNDSLKQSTEHLNLIYNPFKKNSTISPDLVFKRRAALRRYRDQVAKNFNKFKKIAFKCFVLLQPFASDTQTTKLIKALVMSIGDIEKQVNKFIELFSDLKSENFAQAVVKAIENIKKESEQLEQIIDDRIKDHLQNNILARSWVDSISQDLQEKVERKTPFITRLVEERERTLKQ